MNPLHTSGGGSAVSDGMGVEPGTRPIVKVCYVVEDARKAAAEWAARLGAGPFFVKPWPLSGPGYVLDHTSAFGQWGELLVELMQFNAVEPASLAAALVRPGLHHVTWFADSLPAESERLVQVGWPVILAADTGTGTAFTFHDASDDFGHLIEIYEQTLGVRNHYATVRVASEGWDGRDPVRERTS